jgi:penicillin-binding protein 1A
VNRRSHRLWFAPLLLACGAALLLVSLATIAFLVWLRPAAQDWQQSLRLGPVTLPVSVEKAVWLASHHQIAAWLDGHTIGTAGSAWRIGASEEETTLICAPCELAHRSLGPGRIHLDRVSLSLKPDRAGYSGLLQLRAGTHEIALPWTGEVTPRNATIHISAAGLPMAEVFAVLGHDLPETRIAIISGHLSLRMQLQLPERRLDTQWSTQDFRVAGLGTEQLLTATLPERCDAPSRRAISGWLPIAVVAAEDQTFSSHPGYDIRQINAALRSNAEEHSLRGASTITQQLARLLYTDDARTPQRKLRELLYAVEMERTLGKGKILQLYLALAPWGQNICGAENAAQRYLGKSANVLTPAEAAWLAGLLTSPDAQLRQVLTSGVDATRTAHIVQEMRPMSTRRRARALAAIASLQPNIAPVTVLDRTPGLIPASYEAGPTAGFASP